MVYSVMEIIAGTPAAKAVYSPFLEQWQRGLADFLEARGVTDADMRKWPGTLQRQRVHFDGRSYKKIVPPPGSDFEAAYQHAVSSGLELVSRLYPALVEVYPERGFFLKDFTFPNSPLLSRAFLKLPGGSQYFPHTANFYGEGSTMHHLELNTPNIHVEKSWSREPQNLAERVSALVHGDTLIQVRETVANFS